MHYITLLMEYLVSLAVWSGKVPTNINVFSPLRQYNLEFVNLPSTRHFAVPPLTDTQLSQDHRSSTLTYDEEHFHVINFIYIARRKHHFGTIIIL